MASEPGPTEPAFNVKIEGHLRRTLAIAVRFRDAARLRDESLLARLRPSAEFQEIMRDLVFPSQPFAHR